MIAARGIYQKDIRPRRKALNGGFQKRSFTHGKESRLIGLERFPSENLDCIQAALPYQRGSGPAGIADCPAPFMSLWIADKASGDRAHSIANLPRVWAGSAELILYGD
jgi:hypothetical protein